MLRAWWRRMRGLEAAGNEASPPPAPPLREAEEETAVFRVHPDQETVALPRAAGADETRAVTSAGPPPRAEVEAPPPPAPTRVERPAAAPPRIVGVLVAVGGEFRGSAWTLVEGANRLGREYSCEICLPTERLAPQHASIEHRAGSFHLEILADEDALLNDEPTRGALLRDGDALHLGMTSFRFRSIVES